MPTKEKGLSSEIYIDELNDYSQAQNKKIVAIDPGKCDLIYCVDDCNKEANKFRYSHDHVERNPSQRSFLKYGLH